MKRTFRSAFTLLELIIAFAAGIIIIGLVLNFYLFTHRQRAREIAWQNLNNNLILVSERITQGITTRQINSPQDLQKLQLPYSDELKIDLVAPQILQVSLTVIPDAGEPAYHWQRYFRLR
jgi:type II secretory pathway pseudopilin PulG